MNINRGILIAGTVVAASTFLTACGGAAGPVKSTGPAQAPVAATGPEDQPAPQALQNPEARPTEQPQADQSRAERPAAGQPPSSARQRANWRGKLTLTAADDAVLGQIVQIVQNGRGFTLYRFDNDTAKPSMSNCGGDCAEKWPPVVFRKSLVLKGVDKAQVGQIMRKDGICQATLNGWPLYRFAKDTGPGDTKGQGVGGAWSAIRPDSTKANGGAAVTG
ncbi:hypothetical protein [Actinomadura sp. 6N118]|uniref:hypothetical protein n=1 Tax=Actinomadura sp. 6N118 TaxID=3375151 RepID=UPI0037B7E732